MNVVDSSGWLEYFADSIILATARAHHGIVWTEDAYFKNITGVRYTQKQ